MRRIVFLVLLALCWGACNGSGLRDASVPDADATADVRRDVVMPDTGDDTAPREADADAAPVDTSTPGGPLGPITGMCGVLDTELTSTTPHYVDNTVTFPVGFTLAMSMELGVGAQEILRDGTAGGSSGYSEAFAFEMLDRCEGATLIKSETEIVYDAMGSITDMLVEIDGERIGVSVTRGVTVTGVCMRADTYTDMQARDLLTDKLTGVNEASTNVSSADAWTKQILFIYADTGTHAAQLMSVWGTLSDALRADTILLVSTTEGMDEFIYFEDRC